MPLARRSVVPGLALLGLLGLGLLLRSAYRDPPEPRAVPGANPGLRPALTASHAAPDDRAADVGRGLQEVGPGMARSEVEAVLGPPAAAEPATRAGSGVRYQTRYPVYTADPLPFAPDFRGRGEAVLEFDAARPGHPLVRLWCEPGKTPAAGAAAAGVIGAA